MESDAPSPLPPVLVLCQLVGLEALRARVPAALRRTIDQLNRLLAELSDELGGERVSSPAIGVLTRWRDADTALAFAVRLQREALTQDWPTTLLLRPEASEWSAPDGTLLHRGPRVRCAIHIGSQSQLTSADGTVVLAGPALYQTARILATLHGGQVVMSDRAWEGLSEVPERVVAVDLGEHSLIGVQGMTRFHQVLPAELARRSFPPPRTRDVARTNAPALRPGFFGRDGDLQALGELAAFGLRAVTITGPPGVGKSGLLARYLSVQGRAFTAAGSGGAWLCRVEGADVAHVVAAVAGCLGLSLRFGRNDEELIRQVGAVVAGRGPLLLAVDGMAARPDALADAFRPWLKVAPELRLLVTAPDRLGLPGEIIYKLAPLPFASMDGARNEAAVRLFIEKASVCVPRFQATDPAAIASIVNVLGGVPLTIEVAAGLVGKLSIEQLLSEVQQIEPSLDAAVELTWSHLDPEDRHVLSSCSVYPSGFDRLGAEAVVDIRETGIDAIAVLQRLRRSGLVYRSDDPRTPEVRRFRVDPRVRRRALAALSDEERIRIQRRAALQTLGQCERWAEDGWGPQGPEALARLALEWVNLASVASRAATEGAEPVDVDLGLRAVAVLWPLVSTSGPTGLFVQLASGVLDRAHSMLEADPVFQARAFAARAGARRSLGDHAGALADAERGADVARRWGDPQGEGLCLLFAGLVHHGRGRFAEAEAELSRAVVALDVPDPGQAAVARGVLAVVCMDLARVEEAEAHLERAIQTLERLQWRRHLGLQLTTRGLMLRRIGRMEEAREHYARAAQIHREVGDRRSLAVCLVNQASLELRQGRLVDGSRTLASALRASQETGDRVAEAHAHGNLGLAALAMGSVAEARQQLLAALAINRDLRDRAGEAQDTGYLGVAHHLGGQLDGARDCYRRALRVLDERAPARDRAHFHAWLAAVEAEDGAGELAASGLATARTLAEQSREPVAIRVVEVVGAIVRLYGAPSDAATLDTVRGICESSSLETDIDVVIARARLVQVLEEITRD